MEQQLGSWAVEGDGPEGTLAFLFNQTWRLGQVPSMCVHH